MSLESDISQPHEEMPVEKRPLLIDGQGRLTSRGKLEIDHHFKELLKHRPEEALRRYHNMEPCAQEYVKNSKEIKWEYI